MLKETQSRKILQLLRPTKKEFTLTDFNDYYTRKVQLFEEYLENYLTQQQKLAKHTAIDHLYSSIRYSFNTGGKRFRPTLSLMVGEALSVPDSKVLPFALSVEMIHTYSLIHDDLPSMDNDDLRRGKPTNHKVFGEAFALLAGDALLTDAFHLLSNSIEYQSSTAIKLIHLLSANAGSFGMVGGQAIDLRQSELLETQVNEENLNYLHQLKTGALISAAAVGPGIINNADEATIKKIKNFGYNLGLAFQIADDLHDKDKANEGTKNFVFLLGEEKTKKYLSTVSNNAINDLSFLGDKNKHLIELVDYNLNRKT